MVVPAAPRNLITGSLSPAPTGFDEGTSVGGCSTLVFILVVAVGLRECRSCRRPPRPPCHAQTPQEEKLHGRDDVRRRKHAAANTMVVKAPASTVAATTSAPKKKAGSRPGTSPPIRIRPSARQDRWRRPGRPQSRRRRARASQRLRGGRRSDHRPHPDDGQPAPDARRRFPALLHRQGFGRLGGASRRASSNAPARLVSSSTSALLLRISPTRWPFPTITTLRTSASNSAMNESIIMPTCSAMGKRPA